MKKGFTLIELLAVIVILAIIALIATPIILGIINDAREESNERSVELYASAVRNAVAAYQLTNTNAPTSFSDLNVQYDGKVECTVEELYADGSFYLEGCKVNNGEKEYSYGTKQGGSTVAKVCSIEKQDASKYSKGDVITCNIGDEPDKFYVIADAELSAPTIQVLTEKNIHTTEYRQSDSAGTVAFSNTSYWVDENDDLLPSYGTTYPSDVYNNNSLLYSIVEEYVSYLNTELTNATGSLLTYSQAENLDCSGDDNSCSDEPEWVYSTSYWTGSASAAFNVWRVNSIGNFDYGLCDDDGNSGVRPVITISTSEI